jgi:cysteinyl-tRNA synthetase
MSAKIGGFHGELLAVRTLGEPHVEQLIKEREDARKQRDFARADQIRKELTEAGILLEDTKDGVRWRRK